MGKKNKKDKKGKGAEKTLEKTNKKLEKKAKKALQEKGEEDIEEIIKQFEQEDKKKAEVIEEKCPPPSPRCNMTLTAHPTKEELIMFGGEYFSGKKTLVYKDLFFFNCKKGEWYSVRAPNGPPPRCAHQAVALKQGDGQLWIFGGEFTSVTQSQFHHYNDLWVFHLKEKRWEKINSPGAPSSRSGHRMVACKKQLIVFGGFHDNIRSYKYFNDLYSFNLETYKWTKINPSGVGPSPRSACQMLCYKDHNHVMVFGGYSKHPVKKDIDKGTIHTDMFSLSPQVKTKDETLVTEWKWVQVKQSGLCPEPRTGMTGVVYSGTNAFFFGGVFDEEEDEEEVNGIFFNDMFSLELDRGKWHESYLRGKKDAADRKRRRRKPRNNDDSVSGEGSSADCEVDETEEDIKKMKLEEDAEKEVESQTVGAFTLKQGNVAKYRESDKLFTTVLGPKNAPLSSDSDDDIEMSEEFFVPRPRMNMLMAVIGSTLYMYGGVYEVGDRQYTLDDMYSVDLKKMDTITVIKGDESSKQEWEESDSEDSEGSDDDDDEDVCAPEVEVDETLADYFDRTRDYWKEAAIEDLEDQGQKPTAKTIKPLAKTLAQLFYEQSEKS